MRTVELRPAQVIHAVKACVVLHNYLCIQSRGKYIAPSDVDAEIDGQWVKGQWRKQMDERLRSVRLKRSPNTSTVAKTIRDNFREYFISENGSVPWQDTVTFGVSNTNGLEDSDSNSGNSAQSDSE